MCNPTTSSTHSQQCGRIGSDGFPSSKLTFQPLFVQRLRPSTTTTQMGITLLAGFMLQAINDEGAEQLKITTSNTSFCQTTRNVYKIVLLMEDRPDGDEELRR